MPERSEQKPTADEGPVERMVGRPVEQRADGCTQGCNGCDDCTDYDDYDDRPGDECLHCHGDGMDPDCDYLLPCPDCGGSW